MNKLLKLLGFLFFLGGGELSFAQADLRVSVLGSDINRIAFASDPSVSAQVSNVGNVASDPFVIKLWASIDNEFTESDLPVISDSISLGSCVSAPGTCPFGFQRTFKFPYPGQEVSPDERLVGDIRTARQWIGERVYIKACLSINGAALSDCVESSVVVYPPPVVGVSVSQGESADYTEVAWEALFSNPGDDSFIDEYIILEVNGADGTQREISVAPGQSQVEVTASGQRLEKLRIVDAVAGVRQNYSVRPCSDTVRSGRLCADLPSRFFPGHRLEKFVAAEGLDRQAIEVNWTQFLGGFFGGYRIRRCTLNGGSSSCINFYQRNLATTTYRDSEVEQGKSYKYTISACEVIDATDGIDSNCVAPGFLKTGDTNYGFIDIRDRFEDDDNAAQATLVTESVTQARSFDTGEDADWVELIVPSRQSVAVITSGPPNGDTEITLYNSAVSPLASSTNTQGVVTSYATLKTPVLDAGRYFLKVNQEQLPGFFVGPFPNYSLEVSMVGGVSQRTVLTPIIMLLLEQTPQDSPD